MWRWQPNSPVTAGRLVDRSTAPGLFRGRDCQTRPGRHGDAVFPPGAIATPLRAAPAHTNIRRSNELSRSAFQIRPEDLAAGNANRTRAGGLPLAPLARHRQA